MKYDKMVALNQVKKQENISKVKREIEEMLYRKEKITIKALAGYTKLDRSYFYRNAEARCLVENAMLEQGECYNPKKVIFDRAFKNVNMQLKLHIQNLKEEINRLENENQQLLEENIKLRKQLKAK